MATKWKAAVTGVVAAGLGVDAYVHWRLAPGFDGVKGTASPQISQGELFRLETVLALIAMALVLVTRRRRSGRRPGRALVVGDVAGRSPVDGGRH